MALLFPNLLLRMFEIVLSYFHSWTKGKQERDELHYRHTESPMIKSIKKIAIQHSELEPGNL